MDKHTSAIVFFEVALLTIVVLLVDAPQTRAALAIVPTLLLARGALGAARTDRLEQRALPPGVERREDGVARSHLEQFLKQFREFYSTCHLLGDGTIDSEEALQRTAGTERELNQLIANVLSETRRSAGVEDQHWVG